MMVWGVIDVNVGGVLYSSGNSKGEEVIILLLFIFVESMRYFTILSKYFFCLVSNLISILTIDSLK